MQCNPEDQRKSYSGYSFEWIGVKVCIDMQWEQFHSFPIEHKKSLISSNFHDRGWHGQSNHCTTVAHLNHARRHATDGNWISLQDHCQQRILITRCRSILVLQDSFSPPPTLATSARHLEAFCCFVVPNWRIPPQNGNLFEEFQSWTEESFFPCWLTWWSTQFSAFATIRGHFVCSPLHPFLSFNVPLRPLVGLPPPSNLFIHSLYPFCPRHNSRERSLA